MSEQPLRQAREANTDVDRYPTAREGLARIFEEANLPEGPIESLECMFMANGECTYRIRAPRADESDGGWLPSTV